MLLFEAIASRLIRILLRVKYIFPTHVIISSAHSSTSLPEIPISFPRSVTF